MATAWHTLESAREQWPDAPFEDDALWDLLQAAQAAVVAYAPALVEGALFPPSYRIAQLMQARNVWNAGKVSSDGDLGGEGFSFSPRPMDRTIRSLLRPRTGVPTIG